MPKEELQQWKNTYSKDNVCWKKKLDSQDFKSINFTNYTHSQKEWLWRHLDISLDIYTKHLLPRTAVTKFSVHLVVYLCASMIPRIDTWGATWPRLSSGAAISLTQILTVLTRIVYSLDILSTCLWILQCVLTTKCRKQTLQGFRISLHQLNTKKE